MKHKWLILGLLILSGGSLEAQATAYVEQVAGSGLEARTGYRNSAGIVQEIIFNCEAILTQNAAEYNEAQITQSAGYDLLADYQQTSGSSYNSTSSYQTGSGNMALIAQEAAGYNYLRVEQDGNRNMVLAWESEVTVLVPARQISTSEYNHLAIIQDGDDNVVNLWQESEGFNHSEITQANHNNSLSVYQTGGGSSFLRAFQMGNSRATVIQNIVSGEGTITLMQQ